MNTLKEVKLNNKKLQKAIQKLNNKIEKTADFSYDLLRYVEIKSKLKELINYI